MGLQPNDLLDRLTADGAQAELFSGSADSLEVKFTAGEVKTAMAREASGLGLRAIKDGRLGFVGSRDTSPTGLERLLQNVANSLEVGDPARVEFPASAPAPVDGEALQGHCAATAELTVEDLVGIGKETVAQLRERHPDFVFDATVRRSRGRAALRNSAGAQQEERYTSFSFVVEANRTQDEDVLLDYDYVVARGRARADLPGLVERLSQRLTWGLEVVPAAGGTMPVLFSPAGAMVLWGPLLEALNGKPVMLGTSPLRERVGERILNAAIEVVDDGLLVGGLASSPYDDEGIPRQRRTLVADGVLQGFVHDLETARATGSEPTGNGERGGATARPSPGCSNLLVRGGEQAQADLLSGIERGILVHSVMGRGQGNTLPGTFSNPLDLAFLIEGGEVKGRVKDLSIAGSIYELLDGQLAGLSREVEDLGSYRLPWVLIEGMNVVGKSSA